LDPWLGGGYGTVAGLLLISAVLLSSTLQRVLNHPWLTGLGRLSYAAYGVHGVILASAVMWFMDRLHPPHAEVKFAFDPDGLSYHLAALAAFVFYLALTWLISAALTVFVDEPCTRFSGKLARKLVGSRSPGAAQH
jgi:peptidoglycan/LPS O-acetylase OafA/YrhL